MRRLLPLILLVAFVTLVHGDYVLNSVLKAQERKDARKAAAQGLPPTPPPPTALGQKRQRDKFAVDDPVTRLPEADHRTSHLTSKEHQINQAAFHRTSKYQRDTRRKMGARPAIDPEAAKKHLSEDEQESLGGRRHIESQMRNQAKEMNEALRRQRENPQGWRQKASNHIDNARKTVAKALTFPTRMAGSRQLRKSYSMPELRPRPVW